MIWLIFPLKIHENEEILMEVALVSLPSWIHQGVGRHHIAPKLHEFRDKMCFDRVTVDQFGCFDIVKVD